MAAESTANLRDLVARSIDELRPHGRVHAPKIAALERLRDAIDEGRVTPELLKGTFRATSDPAFERTRAPHDVGGEQRFEATRVLRQELLNQMQFRDAGDRGPIAPPARG